MRDWVFRKTSSNNPAACSEVILLPVIVPDNFKEIADLVEKKREAIVNNEDTSLQDRAIDDLIYGIYGLTDEESSLIENYYQ